MSYIKSTHLSHQDRLRLLSFSPDDQFNHSSKITKNAQTYLKSDRLYQVYHNHSIIQNTSNKQLSKESRIPGKNIQNPELTKQNPKLKLVNEPKASLQESKIRAKSSHEIKAKKCYISINVPQNPHKYTTKAHQNSEPILSPSKTFYPNSTLINTISHHKNYTASKKAFKNLSKSRIQQEKDLTFLSRTFHNVKKSEQKTKKMLIDGFTKRMQRETRQQQKQQVKRKHAQWLENQKNQNSTKKYMNHLLKYHAKKSLVEKNTEYAQQMRQRLKSQQSIKSQRSLIISQQRKQKAYLMKVQNSQNIHNAKMRTFSRIQSRSNSVRNEMAKVYECEGELEAWRIQQIDERSKFMLATIDNSKKNKELLQKVLKDSKNMDSTVLFETLANNLNPTKGSFRSNPK